MDIDIDISPDVNVNKLLNVINASMIEKGEIKKHVVGKYIQNMPQDPLTGLAAIPYKEAEQYGFYKIDFLNLNILKHFTSKNHIDILVDREPKWELLEDREVIEQLFHLSKHANIVLKIKPKSILEIADVLALIRPNKYKLIDSYIKDKKKVRPVLYTKLDASDLRKSHALSYALVIVLQLHIIGKTDSIEEHI